jgi:hypothetical protein
MSDNIISNIVVNYIEKHGAVKISARTALLNAPVQYPRPWFFKHCA